MQTHRRPVQHWRVVHTKKGRKPVLVNKGMKYIDFVKKRMKDPEIQKLPFTKRMAPIAKEWNAAKAAREKE